MSGFITADGAEYFLNLFAAREQAQPKYYTALIIENRPGLTTAGSELTEPSAADYSRAMLENVSGNWSVDQSTLANNIEIAFPVPSTEWGIIRHWAVLDTQAVGSGRILLAGDLDPFQVVIGEQPYLPVGAMAVMFDLDSWRAAT